MSTENIRKRQEKRAEIVCNENAALLMISESLDDYIYHRIQTDKVLEGILEDIEGNLANIAENGIAIDKREK